MNPYEMAIDMSYSRKLSEIYSMAVTARYIRSDMGDQSNEMVPGNSVAADVSGYLEKYVVLGLSESLWTFGFNISNIGTKVSYDGGTTNEFIPTLLKVGAGLLYPMDEYNRIGVYLDLGKYLVPSLPKSRGTGEEEQAEYDRLKTQYNTMSFMTGIFRSFYDAPGGLSEELREINFSLGAEYGYNEQFFLRGGYYYENPYKGNRQYFSLGAGFRMSVFQLDAAYLLSTVPSNPLDQTLRFSLSFDMDGIQNLFR
jgi:long-subunit fatty acid transport protein